MDTFSRRAGIVEAVEREGYVRLQTLSQQYGVAPVTIHRDLDYLVAQGRIQRVRGGARPAASSPNVHTDYAMRSRNAIEKKEALAGRALEEIPDGSTIFFDSSTTVEALARRLERESTKSLTVVTNSPAIAFRMHAAFVHVIVVPGELDQSLKAITGRWTAEFLDHLNFQAAFMSAAGLTLDSGMMTTQRELAEVAKTVFARASRRIALIDSSKFDTRALISMAPLEAIDLVITDDGLPDAVAAKYRATGLNLVVSETTQSPHDSREPT